MDWVPVLGQLWQLVRRVIEGYAHEGMYEVLDFDLNLELADPRGETAVFRKREKVRFLQNNVIAYQDQAWGDGELFADYKCSPGVQVDRYKEGSKYRVLISLRETKHEGDKLEIQTERTVRGGFTQPEEAVETEVSFRMRKARLSVTFPLARPPQRALLVEQNANRTHTLDAEHFVHLPDGRIQVQWETERPRLYERYAIRWTW